MRRRQPQKRYVHPGVTPLGRPDPSKPTPEYKPKTPRNDGDRAALERAREKRARKRERNRHG
jgi:hypothetical protein